ncbi:MAG: DUF3656 domain-containing protein [Oscillospiraceae bacterium]
MRDIEILAPVGDEAMLRAAVFAGANAVYLGMQGFNARRSATNFTEEGLCAAVAFCHARGVHVYVTLNTTIYPSEISNAANLLYAIARSGADAVIVQDLAAARLAKSIVPSLALHASTQMTVHSLLGVKALEEMGFSRVILSRELNGDEIAEITAKSNIETEVFIHGALCMSMSGQCYLSAFFGGRSGNRGSCAGPCRLPFSAGDEGECHLSLKDMCHISHIPQLASAGVSCVKIEGRLRTAEYCAAAVNACRCALNGEEYNEQLLQDVFSRSGFTDSYITGNIDKTMYGIRTEGDTTAAKAALPQLRELYRRERQCVDTALAFTISADGAKLKAEAGGQTAIVYSEAEVQKAEKDCTEAYKRALSKTGGTPFNPKEITVEQDGLWFLPSGEVGEMRRRALEMLLAKLEQPSAREYKEIAPIHYTMRAKKPLRLCARFESTEQLPINTDAFEKLIFPLSEYLRIPDALRAKAWLELPRALFGIEKGLPALIAEADKLGFGGYCVQNLAHIQLIGGKNAIGSFGLNVSNPMAAEEYKAMGLCALTLTPELSVQSMAVFPEDIETMAIAYGHMPLMLTRACPMHNVRTCEGCDKKGELLDRKRMRLPLRCKGGVRTIYNPVPIYMGDKQSELPTDFGILYFTIENKKDVALVIRQFLEGEAFDGDFTRGLYFKGTN